MNQIGSDFKYARVNASLSLDEASDDTDIPKLALEQIEEGNIGSFKDIFELRNYLKTYAKYLGLDENKVIDEFNEYMFEYTSKIPLEELQKAIHEKEKNEELEKTNEIKAISPYLQSQSNNQNTRIIITVVVIIILVALTLIWAIKQVS